MEKIPKYMLKKGNAIEQKRSDKIQALPLVATRLSITNHVWLVSLQILPCFLRSRPHHFA